MNLPHRFDRRHENLDAPAPAEGHKSPNDDAAFGSEGGGGQEPAGRHLRTGVSLSPQGAGFVTWLVAALIVGSLVAAVWYAMGILYSRRPAETRAPETRTSETQPGLTSIRADVAPRS